MQDCLHSCAVHAPFNESPLRGLILTVLQNVQIFKSFCYVGTYQLSSYFFELELWKNMVRNGVTNTTAGHTSGPPLLVNPVCSTPVFTLSLLHSRNPCQDFQAQCQSRGSGGLEACSLVKYLSYVIDVSTVINLAAAHPSSWPMPARLHGGLWRSCQTGSDEVCLCVRLFVETFCFDCWQDCCIYKLDRDQISCDGCLWEKAKRWWVGIGLGLSFPCKLEVTSLLYTNIKLISPS